MNSQTSDPDGHPWPPDADPLLPFDRRKNESHPSDRTGKENNLGSFIGLFLEAYHVHQREIKCEPLGDRDSDDLAPAKAAMRRQLSLAEARVLERWLQPDSSASDPATRETLTVIWMATRAWENLRQGLHQRFPHWEGRCEEVVQEAFARLLRRAKCGEHLTREQVEAELNPYRLWCRAADAYRGEQRMVRAAEIFEYGYTELSPVAKKSPGGRHVA